MALTDLTRISTSGIATGSTIDSPILRKDVDFRGDQVGVGSALFDSSERRLDFKDNVKLRFGDSGDLELYATGSNSTIAHNGDGNLIISTADGEKIYLDSSEIILRNAASTETLIKATPGIDGGVELYDGADNKRFETTSTGSIVTGILTATGHFSGQTYNTAGIATFYNLRVSNDLTVEGTTTTLDTNLIGVDRIEVGANSNTVVGVAITQSGTADIFNLYDGSTEVFSVADGGNVDVAGNILTRSDDNTAQFQHNAVKFQTSGGGHIDHETTNQNLNFRVTKSSAADTNMMQINAASEQTKFHKVVTVGLQGGGDTTQIGGGSGIGAYLQLNYASNSIVNTKLMGNNDSWLNSHYGNLGIGTQTPGVKVEIKGTAATLLRLDSSNAQGTSFRIRNSGTDKMYMGLAADFITGQSGNVTDSAIRASGALLFASGGGTERLRILSDGNVGIGTEIPTGKLEIADAAQTNLLILKRTAGNSGEFSVQLGGSDPGVLFSTSGISDDFVFRPGGNERLRITSGGQLELSKDQDGVTGRPTNRIVFKDTDSSVAANQPIGEISWYSTDAGMVNVNSYIRGINEATNGSGALTFGVKAAGSSEIEALRIKSDGDIRAGDSANTWAGDRLEVAGAKEGVLGLANYGSTASEAATINFYRSISGTVGNDTVPTDGIGEIRFRGWSGNAYQVCAKILASADGTWNSSGDNTDTPGNLTFHTTPDGSSTVEERLRIDSDGKVGIGTENPDETLELWKASGTNLLKVTSEANSTIGIEIEKTGSTTQSWRIADGQTVNGTLEFYDATESETRLAIDGSGRVIIGQHNHAGGGALVVCGNSNTPNTYGCASFCRIQANPTSGTTLTNLRFSSGSAGTNRAAEINVKADSNWNDGTSQESKMIFTVASSGGGNTAGNDLMTLKGNGNVEINRGDLVMADGYAIDFSADGNAAGADDEKLDDYEEGDWTPTPVITHQGGSGALSSIQDQYGRYVKVGRLVRVWFYFKFTASAITNCNVGVSGLPFTISNDGQWNNGFHGGIARRGVTGGETYICEGMYKNTTQINVLRKYNNYGFGNTTQSAGGTAAYLVD